MAARAARWRRWGIRFGVAFAALVLGLVLGHGALIDWMSGHSERRALRDPDAGLSPATRALLGRCFEGLEAGLLVDHHAHLAGQGNGSACWVNPRMRSPVHLRDWIRFRTYRSAAAMEAGDPDAAYVEDLAGLARAQPIPMRVLLLPFDYRHTRGGARDLERSSFHVPNDHALDARGRHPDLFLAAASIHPDRPDALVELRRVHAAGVRVVKWLPAVHGIDLAAPERAPFYAECARLGVVLLVHVGEERAVRATADQELGNPLHLRHPLRAGVTVLAAHCASLGTGVDLDHPDRPRVPAFDLFLRLMGEPEWEGRLYGEISTVTQRNRYPGVLATLLERADLHPRLVHGSDWPLPAINVLYSTRALVEDGFLTPEEREALNELYHHNPLLFDLCLKRTVHAPGSGARFPAEVFHSKLPIGE